MKILIISIFILKCCNGTNLNTALSDYPFYVGIFLDKDYTEADDPEPVADYDHYLCGGTIIGPFWALTAAHCTAPILEMPLPSENFFIKSGETIFWNKINKGDPGYHTIIQIVQHEEYEDMRHLNDISLIKVADQFPTKVIGASGKYFNYSANSECWVLGYGMVYDGKSTAPSFNIIPMTILNHRMCAAEYNKTLELYDIINPWNFCGIAMLNDIDYRNFACSFGSGGPVVIKGGVLVGIVSYGDSCGIEYPGVFTRISAYVKWFWKTQVRLQEKIGMIFFGEKKDHNITDS